MAKMRLGWYAGASTALAGSVVLSAFHQRANFYSAMVYLAQSNFCLLVMVNFTLLIYSIFIFALTRLCYGRLRAVEVESLTERAWFAITETCLAMTIFRDEIGPWFIVMFTALVTGKVWGWIGDGRVEVLEQQPPANPRLFHTRLSVSLAVSCIYDIWILQYTINTVIQHARPTMMVMFLFEFAVLTTCSWRTGVRYVLSLAEQKIVKVQTRQRLLERQLEVREQRAALVAQREQAAAAGEEVPEDQEPLPSEDDIDEMDIEVPGWAAKGEWVLWLDLVSDMVKLGIYVAFFFMLLTFYGLPIHIMRDLFMTSRDFVKRLNALLRYRRAIQEMNRYLDATEEDLARENTCIICREEMRPWDGANEQGGIDRVRPKKLPCGHILHLGCLKSWLERQQVCPTCRTPVTGERARAAQNNRAAAALRIEVGRAQPQGQPPPANDRPNNQGRQNAQQPQNQQQPGGARVFNLGPLRLGFGANGQQVRELAHQFGIAPGGVNPGQAPAVPAPATAAQNLPEGDNFHNIGVLIQQAADLVQREAQTLQSSQQELQTLFLLMAELHRLRQRQHLNHQPNGQAPQTTLPNPQLPLPFPYNQQPPMPGQVHFPQANHGFPTFPHVPPRTSSPFMARHGTGSSGLTSAIPAGSPELPEGVVIPPGWSLMPLQRLDGPHNLTQPASAVGGLHTNGEAVNANQTTTPAQPNLSANSPVGTAPLDATPSIAVTEEASESRPADQPQFNPANAPTPVVAPSPVMPNWGGPAQLFNGENRLEQADTTPTRTEPQTESGEASQAREAPQDKGKAKAVTVEEAEDDEE